MKLVIATKNKNKIAEIKHKFSSVSGLKLLDLSAFKDMPDIDETGSTFLENAVLKARAVCDHTGMPSMADDSGLVVDALGGRPGVLSARYGGPGLTDSGRNELLLGEMRDVPDSTRTARFVCSIAVCLPDGRLFDAEGRCEGTITRQPSGDHGFGYDPVFYVASRGCTMAEIPLEEKNTISHRAIALEKTALILKGLS